MGLSASQARLLSVTQRISNNELKSQILANNKVRLADQNVAATSKYIQALESSKMQYVSYDESGSTKNIALTFNALNNYSPLKKQYALYNSQNQFFVNETDATNFENSTSLFDFLEKYDIVKGEHVNVKNPQWEEDYGNYLQDLINWEAQEPRIEDFTTVNVVPPKWIHSDSAVYDAVDNIGCFGYTQQGKRCYMHVLAAILGFGTFTTSDGNTFEIKKMEDIGWQWNSCSVSEAATMDGLREQLKNDPVSDWEYEGDLLTESHGTVPVKGDGSDADKYNVPGGGNAWQKCIDLAWELHFSYNGSDTGGTASKDELEKFWYFIEVDVGNGHLEDGYTDTIVDQEGFDGAYEEWLTKKPVPITTPEYIQEYVYGDLLDKPKAQWYTNLWYLMDGMKQSDVISVSCDGEGSFNKYILKNVNKKTTGETGFYKVIEDEYASDSTWLQFMLTNGLITMEQAGLKTTGFITWEGTEWSSTSDIKEVDNDALIARAEAEYNNTLRQIQAEDKKIDNDIKKLDTEHSALKSELDSIKNVLSKNVERSFTTFS